MKPDTARKLVEPFDRSKLKKTPQKLDYIPISEVVARMNEVIGVGNWRVEILDTQTWGERQTQVGVAPTHVIASVRVHLVHDDSGLWTWCDGMGGQDVGFFNSPHEKWLKDKKYAKPNQQVPPEPQGADAKVSPGPLNLGDNFKGACSDATKKALQHFGVGLELARDGVALEINEETVDLSAKVAGLSQPERKRLAEEWKKKFTFKAGEVPISQQRTAETLIDSIIGTETTSPKGEGVAAESGTTNDPIMDVMSPEEREFMAPLDTGRPFE